MLNYIFEDQCVARCDVLGARGILSVAVRQVWRGNGRVFTVVDIEPPSSKEFAGMAFVRAVNSGLTSRIRLASFRRFSLLNRDVLAYMAKVPPNARK